MEEYEKLIEISPPWYVSNIKVSREVNFGIPKFEVSITNDKESNCFTMKGANDLDIIPAIYQSERVVISKELGCFREFGSIRVECFDDGDYSEYWCDHFENA